MIPVRRLPLSKPKMCDLGMEVDRLDRDIGSSFKRS